VIQQVAAATNSIAEAMQSERSEGFTSNDDAAAVYDYIFASNVLDVMQQGWYQVVIDVLFANAPASSPLRLFESMGPNGPTAAEY
jgi:hypothetical protein